MGVETSRVREDEGDEVDSLCDGKDGLDKDAATPFFCLSKTEAVFL